MKTQFVTDDQGKKLGVILPIKEYNRRMDDLQELEDTKCYDAAKKGAQEFIDAEQAFREFEKKHEQKQERVIASVWSVRHRKSNPKSLNRIIPKLKLAF